MRVAVLVVLFSLLGPGVAAAQELRPPAARQGYYLGGGVRSGVTSAENETVGGFGALTHLGGVFRFGQMTLPWLGFGLSIPGGTERNDAWSLNYGGLLLEAQLEPFDFDLAFRVGAGAGGGAASRVDEADARADDPEFFFGSMYSLGVSYDWFPFHDPQSYESGGLAFTFFVEGRFLPGGDVDLGGGFAGIELTWWTGLDDRKLELPVDRAF
jgi:hypothetical protein